MGRMSQDGGLVPTPTLPAREVYHGGSRGLPTVKSNHRDSCRVIMAPLARREEDIAGANRKALPAYPLRSSATGGSCMSPPLLMEPPINSGFVAYLFPLET